MATPMKKASNRTTTTNTTKDKETIEKTEVFTNKEVETKTIKKFADSDEIRCVSITPGQLFVQGERSKDLYTFADMDDDQMIRYDDLLYMIRRKMPCVFKPRFIIQDEDLLAAFPDIAELYGDLYDSSDLVSILKMSPSQIEKKLPTLPLGAQDSLKIIVMTEIDKGRFDSIQRIKVFDNFYGTNMLLALTQD